MPELIRRAQNQCASRITGKEHPMKNDNDSSEKTSRRQFTKAVVTAAVAAPIAASIACSRGSVNQPVQNVSPGGSPTAALTGPTIRSCDAGVGFEDHIPPMGISGGSLRIELQNKFLAPNAQPPFIYVEGAPVAPAERYGMLDKVRIISELPPPPPGSNQPLITDVTYSLLPTDSELWLWYQRILGDNQPGPEDPDGEYQPPNFTTNSPDFRIKGGRAGNFMSLTVKHKELTQNFDHTHKKGRPFRFKHESDNSIPALKRHFRIGQWMIVLPDGTGMIVLPDGTKFKTVEDAQHNKFQGSGAEEYRMFLFFKHFA
jgi:hypothetical protein